MVNVIGLCYIIQSTIRHTGRMVTRLTEDFYVIGDISIYFKRRILLL